MYTLHFNNMVRLRRLIENVFGLVILSAAFVILINLLNFLPHEIMVDYVNEEYSNLQKLSEEFQAALHKLQNSSPADAVLNCGLKFECGLGCQIHHRMTCVMLANAFQIPFVHYAPNWPYTDSWDEFLDPLGLNKAISKNTMSWEENTTENEPFKKLLQKGIPVPMHMAEMINGTFLSEMEAIHWIIGQYAKFSFQLNSNGEKMLSTWMKKLGLSAGEIEKNPLLGIHVRKTDKLNETRVRRTNEEFMEAAKVYREKLLENNKTFDRINVFIASDDHTVLPYFQKEFGSKDWRFFGFPENRTFQTQRERSSQLAQIIRDIIFLSECDFVICTHTSHVCRLILEIKMYQKFETDVVPPEPESIVNSLDGDYLYEAFFPGHLRVPLNLVFI